MTAVSPIATSAKKESSGDNTTSPARLAPPVVVFRSSASYHPLFWLLIALAPVSTLLSIWFVFKDESSTREAKERSLKGLIWATVAVVIVFALVLPRRFEVVSDASINVITFLSKKWNFTKICAAYDKQSPFAEWHRPKFKFAVNWHNRVIVRRKNGAWDLLVSPSDPAGFVVAVWDVVKENDGAAASEQKKSLLTDSCVDTQ